MVKHIALLCSILSFSCLHAQTFKPFKVVMTAGYALPSGDYIVGGFASYLDAQYAINDKISLGFSTGSAALGPAEKVWTAPASEKFLGPALMYTATGTYYFNTNKNRPFLSLATGLGVIEVNTIKDIDLTRNKVRKLILSPSAGVERGHLRLVAEYAYFGKAEGISSSFLTLKAGVFIGGGRK